MPEQNSSMGQTQERKVMPYRLVDRDGKVCVEKTPTGEEMGCHDNEDDALAQMRALYAAENDG